MLTTHGTNRVAGRLRQSESMLALLLRLADVPIHGIEYANLRKASERSVVEVVLLNDGVEGAF